MLFTYHPAPLPNRPFNKAPRKLVYQILLNLRFDLKWYIHRGGPITLCGIQSYPMKAKPNHWILVSNGSFANVIQDI